MIANEMSRWAIDGLLLTFEGQRYFVWSGWDSVSNNQEQNLYICRMNSPTEPTGGRYIISQPREKWEVNDRPLINEGPEAIVSNLDFFPLSRTRVLAHEYSIWNIARDS